MRVIFEVPDGYDVSKDVEVHPATPARRGRNHCVVESSSCCGDWIVSWHDSRAAAERASQKATDGFRRRKPDGCGWSWTPAWVE